MLVMKVLERRSNLKMGIRELFRKHDVDNSGELGVSVTGSERGLQNPPLCSPLDQTFLDKTITHLNDRYLHNIEYRPIDPRSRTRAQ